MTGFIFIPGVVTADLTNSATMNAAVDNAIYWPAGDTTFCGINTFGLMFQLSGSTSLSPVPLGLFGAGGLGSFYDPSNLATLFQDVAGTIPVTTPGQTVARMLDRSGNGYHATQASAALRPVYAREPKVGTRNRAVGIADVDSLSSWVAPAPEAGITYTKVATGVTGGEPWVEYRVQGTATATQFVQLNNSASTRFPAVAGAVVSASLKAQLVAGTYPASISGLRLDTAELSASNTQLQATSPLLAVTGTTTTFTTTRTLTDALTTQAQMRILFRIESGATVDFTVRITAVQFETGAVRTAWQRSMSQFDVTEAGVPSVFYLASDQVDDSLPATIPSLGTNATVWDSRGTGITILTAQTVGAGAFETLRGAKTYAVGAINRGLVSIETTALTAYLNAQRITP